MPIIRHRETGAPLQDVFAGAELPRALLAYADLNGADARGANLRHADLCNADLRGAHFDGATLTGADATLSESAGSFFARAMLDDARMQGMNKRHQGVVGIDFSGADLTRATLKNSNLNGARFDEPPTEAPKAGTTEDWVYINLTGDTHPMHLHLATFQVVGRTPFDAESYEDEYFCEDLGVPGGIDPSPYATGPMVPAAPEERGFKDTVKVNPGSYTTIRVRFDLPAGVQAPQTYVHHCHILEHEDNDMMRPFVVVP